MLFPDKQNPPVMLSYGVKFYVPDPSKLREDYSRSDSACKLPARPTNIGILRS